MKILTYHSANAPQNRAWIGRFLVNGRILPIFFEAATEADVTSKAETFWREERAKLSKHGVDELGDLLG